MSFSLDIKKFAQKAGDNADMVVRLMLESISNEIMERSPVGDPSKWEGWDASVSVRANEDHWLRRAGFVGEEYEGGHFRANWQLGVGAKPDGEIDGIDPGGKATLEKIKAAVPKKAGGRVYYLTNNLPYAIPLEDGHSQQAPEGIVGLTALKFQDYVKQAVAEVNP